MTDHIIIRLRRAYDETGNALLRDALDEIAALALRKRPIAFVLYGEGEPKFRHASPEADPPEEEGWIALYRRGGSVDAARDGAEASEHQSDSAGAGDGALDALRKMSAKMAEDDGLWFQAETAAEAYVQQELRKLCAAIEGVSPEECAIHALTHGALDARTLEAAVMVVEKESWALSDAGLPVRAHSFMLVAKKIRALTQKGGR